MRLLYRVLLPVAMLLVDPQAEAAEHEAAGVAVMLEVARSVQDGSERPRRSILFLAPTAEESGLLGTEYSVPLAEARRIIARCRPVAAAFR